MIPLKMILREEICSPLHAPGDPNPPKPPAAGAGAGAPKPPKPPAAGAGAGEPNGAAPPAGWPKGVGAGAPNISSLSTKGRSG
jgi:hypothetical protein